MITKLKIPYNGWAKGTLVLAANDGEFFDIGYELKNGWEIGYSLYDIPSDLLEVATSEEQKEVQLYLSAPWDYKNCPIEIITSNK